MSSKDPALQAYLASKYLSGAKADAILAKHSGSSADGPKRKKKKRKVDDGGMVVGGSGGMIIADEDGGWGQPRQEDDEEDVPVVTESRGQFKAKAASSTWSTIREGAKAPPPDPSEQPYVRTPSPEPLDEAPVVVGTTNSPPPPARPSGGLQTAADLKAEQSRRAVEEAKRQREVALELARLKKEQIERGEDPDEADDPTATVYRDASGKRIDLKLEKAERAKLERERVEREMKKMEWGKGLVQKEDKVARKREEERLAAKPMARYADDEDMNDEMRDRERWNDPAANFLTKDKKKPKQSAPRFPRYTGPTPPPNRFGIAPGYRWDGVDRGNGWEAKLMQHRNSRRMHSAAAHEYSTEDM